MVSKWIKWISGCMITILLSGCGIIGQLIYTSPQPVRHLSDNKPLKKDIPHNQNSYYAQQYVTNGTTLLNNGNIEAAFREFLIALDFEPDYSPAYLGLSQYYLKKGLYSNCELYLNKIKNSHMTKGEIPNYYMTELTCNALSQTQPQNTIQWLIEMEKAFYQALNQQIDHASCYYYLARVYLKVKEYQKAKLYLTQVIDQNGLFYEAALSDIKAIIDIENKQFSEKINQLILKQHISRADLAWLLIEELHVNRLLTPLHHLNLSISDIKNHPYESVLIKIIQLNINGLKPYAGKAFEPEMPVNRGDLAIIFEDIFLRATGDKNLTKQLAIQNSPFTDLDQKNPYFNAAFFCTKEHFIHYPFNGEYNAFKPIRGIEALHGIYSLKNKLIEYQIDL